MTRTTKRWLQAALAAILGAAWTSIAAALVDPAAFNLRTAAGLQCMAVMGLVGGLGHLGMYLAQSPMLDSEQVSPAKV